MGPWNLCRFFSDAEKGTVIRVHWPLHASQSSRNSESQGCLADAPHVTLPRSCLYSPLTPLEVKIHAFTVETSLRVIRAVSTQDFLSEIGGGEGGSKF